MDQLTVEAYEAVSILNEDLPGLEWYVPFEIKSFGEMFTAIQFMGETLWTSEEDVREFCEETNKYEPLIDFLRREARKLFIDLTLKMQQI